MTWGVALSISNGLRTGLGSSLHKSFLNTWKCFESQRHFRMRQWLWAYCSRVANSALIKDYPASLTLSTPLLTLSQVHLTFVCMRHEQSAGKEVTTYVGVTDMGLNKFLVNAQFQSHWSAFILLCSNPCFEQLLGTVSQKIKVWIKNSVNQRYK